MSQDNQSIELTFHSDPGHGWLCVPFLLLAQLGIAHLISPYSYVQNDFAYLEEDVDADVFMLAAKKSGLSIEVSEVFTENTPIRSMRSFNLGYFSLCVATFSENQSRAMSLQ